MTRLPHTVVAGAALVGAGAGWVLVQAWRLLTGHAPTPGWSIAAFCALVALAGFVLAWLSHQRNHVRHQPAEPRRGLALVAFAQALIAGGAVMAGLFAVTAGLAIPRLVVEAERTRLLHGAICFLTAVVMVVAGRILERECQTDPHRRGSESGRGGDDSGQ
ncbi:MAG: DUF3180 domain-containing protein [Propionibacteriaceae bacterium]|jgi:MFS family permease|nr:DUF3180 domain-containing protein [Propionibacteriaceae bacterium]